MYRVRKITESIGNVTVRGGEDGKSKGERDGQQSEHDVQSCILGYTAV
jgi:hypothetical protein